MSQNRIQVAINKIEIKLKNVSLEKIQELENSFNDIDDIELIEYQKTQSLAFASNILTLDEASQLYNIIGREFPTVEKYQKRSLAEKIVITNIMMELFKKLRI